MKALIAKLYTQAYWWFAAAAALLAIPHLSFYFFYATLGLGFMLAVLVALWTFSGPILLPIGALLTRWGLTKNWQLIALTKFWLCCCILHVGMAIGFSRWGDVASGMGSKNIPFVEALFWPAQVFGLRPT